MIEDQAQPTIAPVKPTKNDKSDRNIYREANQDLINKAKNVNTLTSLIKMIERGKNYRDVHGAARDAAQIIGVFIATRNELGYNHPRLRDEFVTKVVGSGFGVTEEQAKEVFIKLEESGLSKLDLPEEFLFPKKGSISTLQ